jgi:ankyrin repeat protein
MEDRVDLFTAVELRDMAMVRALLEDDADPNKPNRAGYAPLHIAAQQGYPDVCRLFLEHGADLSQKTQGRRHSRTPLVLAAGEGHADVVKVLLDAAGEHKVSAQDRNDALYVAVSTQRPAAVEALLEAGADPATKPKSYPLTALEVAMTRGSPIMIQAFADAGVKLPLWVYARLGDIDTVKDQLSGGSDVNSTDPMGRSALFHAVRSGHEQIVSLLIEEGADVNRAMTDEPQSTPLYVAAEVGDLRVVRMLVTKGAKVNAQASNGRTPLYMAVLEDHVDVAKFLLESKADPNLTPRLLPKDGHARSESLLEAAEDNEEMQRLLRRYGAK